MTAFLKSVLASVFILLLAMPAARAAEGTVPLESWSMLVGLVGGLALFLYGMDHLAGALKTLAGRTIAPRAVGHDAQSRVGGGFRCGDYRAGSIIKCDDGLGGRFCVRRFDALCPINRSNYGRECGQHPYGSDYCLSR